MMKPAMFAAVGGLRRAKMPRGGQRIALPPLPEDEGRAELTDATKTPIVSAGAPAPGLALADRRAQGATRPAVMRTAPGTSTLLHTRVAALTEQDRAQERARASPTGMLTKKIHSQESGRSGHRPSGRRQLRRSRRPRPRRRARCCARGLRANVVIRIASAAGEIAAAPRPWIARAPMSDVSRPGEPAQERAEREDDEAEHEDAPAPEQVGSAAAEQQEAAEDERVGADHPLQVFLREAEVDWIEGRATFTIAMSSTTMNCTALRSAKREPFHLGDVISRSFRRSLVMMLANLQEPLAFCKYLHTAMATMKVVSTTTSTARSRTRSAWSASAGRCWSCASSCTGRSATPTSPTG